MVRSWIPVSLLPLVLMNALVEARTVEERRLPQLEDRLPDVVATIEEHYAPTDLFELTGEALRRKVIATAEEMWALATVRAQRDGDLDDRALYWWRLRFREALRRHAAEHSLSEAEQATLIDDLERHSRGIPSVREHSSCEVRILITGFDTFSLDQNLGNSNPSGAAALALDGKTFEIDGRRASVEAMIFPVRYEDFDRGKVEGALEPHLDPAGDPVDAVFTISMGRPGKFDLERFPGRRRGTTYPDNDRVVGGSPVAPVPFPLDGKPIDAPEFVQFTLTPAILAALQSVDEPYPVNDNHAVTTLEDGDLEPETLQELAGKTAVAGGGGRYLSNEISYRSLALLQRLGGTTPVGHIHTPTIQGNDEARRARIVAQIEGMLRAVVPVLAADGAEEK